MNQLRDKYKVWRIEPSILTCYFFIWCQDCRIVGFFSSSCQVLVSNNALAQYLKTQRCESFESLEKLFPSSLFVVFQEFSKERFYPLFLKADLAADLIKLLQDDLVNPLPGFWKVGTGEVGQGMGVVCTHRSSIFPCLFLRLYKLPSHFPAKNAILSIDLEQQEVRGLEAFVNNYLFDWILATKLLSFQLIVCNRLFFITITCCFFVTFLTHSGELFKKRKNVTFHLW